MLLLDYIHYLILFAILSFVLVVYLRFYLSLKQMDLAYKSTIAFFVIAVEFPFVLSKLTYEHREDILRQAKNDSTLTEKQKRKLAKMINSRIRITVKLTCKHIFTFPSFIDSFDNVIKQRSKMIKRGTLIKTTYKKSPGGKSIVRELKKLLSKEQSGNLRTRMS